MAGGHSPTLKTILRIEKAIVDFVDYPSRMELYDSLSRKPHYSTFKNVLEYLEASGKIIFNDDKIIYTGINNPKLQALLDSSVVI